MDNNEHFAVHLERLGAAADTITVVLSNELVDLLSGQLYKSPLKAIEELVVNSYDAGAADCFLYVPDAAAQEADPRGSFIVVFDNGIGMNLKGLEELWRIGQSGKKGSDVDPRTKRKLIGKFGIGKLATHTIAHRLTYVSRTAAGIFAVTTDYRRFVSGGTTSPVSLSVRQLTDVKSLLADSTLGRLLKTSGIPLAQFETPSWTLVLLEELKDKARSIQLGRLRRVLETAMPLGSGFTLHLNGTVVESSKGEYERLVDFSVDQLPKERLEALSKATATTWRVENGRLVSGLFKEGISGQVIVTERSLVGKSDDLFRSHGFFVRVRGRLINEDDPSFGITSAYGLMHRFRADLNADDLNSVLTASREGFEAGSLSSALIQVLVEVYNEARQRYEEAMDAKQKITDRKVEQHRNYVNPRYVEYPVADVIGAPAVQQSGAEPDKSWFYLDLPPTGEAAALVKRLYQEPRTKYKYVYSQSGRNQRLARFDPHKATFTINLDHDFVRAHADEPRARLLLEDFVTTEAMLEVYLREALVPAHTVGEILERRDALLRSLSLDHPFSLTSLAASLLDSASNERDLEVNLVAAMRGLGFVAKHISGEGKPDGLAEFHDYPSGPRIITLEAKSSKDVPSLGALDFAGLQQHMKDYGAQGCIVVAPAYPGASKDDDAAAAKRAKELRVSCWTVGQLADFVSVAEARHLTARNLLNIVLEKFAPGDVATAVTNLLKSSAWSMPELYTAIVTAIRDLEDRLQDAARNVSAVAAEVSRMQAFRKIRQEEVRVALVALAEASQGAMTVRDENIIVHVSTAELERRVAGLTKVTGQARRESNFRDGPDRTGA